MRASALVPPAALRTIDRVRTRAFLARTGPATTEYVRRNGLAVTHGPFTGMSYLDGLERTSGDLVAKLTGSYERELHPVIESWVAARPAARHRRGLRGGLLRGRALRWRSPAPTSTPTTSTLRRASAARSLRAKRGGGSRERPLRVHAGDARGVPRAGRRAAVGLRGLRAHAARPGARAASDRWPILVELHEFLDPRSPRPSPRASPRPTRSR